MSEFPPEWVEAAAEAMRAEQAKHEGLRILMEDAAAAALRVVVPLVRADEARRTAEKIRQSVIRLYTGDTHTDDDELGEYDCGVADAECIIAAVRDGLDPEREVIADVIANRATCEGSGA